MTPWRVASNSLAVLFVLVAVARAGDAVLDVPALAAPRLDDGLADETWSKGAAFEIRRGKATYAHVRVLRSGRQLYIGYRSEFKPLALGVRFHFVDPETDRMVAVLVAPLEMPRAPLNAWLNRRGETPARLDVSKGDVRFDFSPEKGFTFAARLPLDLLEIGRPKKRFKFNVELWDTQAQRPLAFYPAVDGSLGSGQGFAALDPVGDWGLDVPVDAPEPVRNEALALLQEIAGDGAAAADGSPGSGDMLSGLMGQRDGKRLDAQLAVLEARLRRQIEAYPNYAALRANLMRDLIGRNEPGQALDVMTSMRERYPSLARDGRQALGEVQLMRSSGRYADALSWLVQHKGLLRRTVDFAREKAHLESLREAWKVEQEYRAGEAQRDDLPRVRVVTDKGEFVLELFEDDAPNTVANFLGLVGRGFYDGTRFHWSVASASLFGGDPNSRDDDPYNDGFGGPGYLIEPEQGRRSNFPFTIAMVSQRRSQWAMGSNFRINLSPAPSRDVRVTVFGRVIEGAETVRRIGYYDTLRKATVIRKRKHDYKVVKRPKSSGG